MPFFYEKFDEDCIFSVHILLNYFSFKLKLKIFRKCFLARSSFDLIVHQTDMIPLIAFFNFFKQNEV
ncbi:hypothetical protein BpHYR1_042462 [Brachionus plicatilis]|uniref:Uncharacterized protein n=1 Tax=Brachionus plicatilis TaxID=10195 RepID=A0A3M7S653_BRAPC|nr:hypothetical protein BpHYR1_042462 [Brachionus plicatilis]